MKVLLGTKNETLGFKPDGRGKGSKIVDIETTVYYIIENEDTQCTIVKVRELMDFENDERGNYELDGRKLLKIEEKFFGKTAHAIRYFTEQMIDGVELVSDAAVLEKIQKTLEDLANSKDFAKFLEEYKR